MIALLPRTRRSVCRRAVLFEEQYRIRSFPDLLARTREVRPAERDTECGELGRPCGGRWGGRRGSAPRSGGEEGEGSDRGSFESSGASRELAGAVLVCKGKGGGRGRGHVGEEERRGCLAELWVFSRVIVLAWRQRTSGD